MTRLERELLLLLETHQQGLQHPRPVVGRLIFFAEGCEDRLDPSLPSETAHHELHQALLG